MTVIPNRPHNLPTPMVEIRGDALGCQWQLLETVVGWSRVVQLDLDMKDHRARISNDSRPFPSKHQATAAALIVQLQVPLGGYAKPPVNG